VNKAIGELHKLGLTKAVGKPCHFSRLNQINDLKNWIQQKFGRVDVLINNAATSLHFGSMLDTSEKAYDKMMELNVKVI
jgi:NAD(P)-dependent dehydrogenase (short-subunit alcohol dehydrogenase family)